MTNVVLIVSLALTLSSVVFAAAFLNQQDSKVRVQNGTWGGPHIGLEITDGRSTIEFDCGHGMIDQPFKTDSAGAFDLPGTYVKESAGPARQDAKNDEHPARYAGRIEGKEMTLTVRIIEGSQIVGRYTLTRGAVPRVAKCG